MPRRPGAPAAAAIGLALALAPVGCGSEEPQTDGEAIAEVLADLRTATASNNAELLCTEVIVRDAGESLEACVDGFATQMTTPGAAFDRPAAVVPVGEPRVEGDVAVQRVADGERRYDVTLRRGPSGWRLELGG